MFVFYFVNVYIFRRIYLCSCTNYIFLLLFPGNRNETLLLFQIPNVKLMLLNSVNNFHCFEGKTNFVSKLFLTTNRLALNIFLWADYAVSVFPFNWSLLTVDSAQFLFQDNFKICDDEKFVSNIIWSTC